MPIWLYTLGNTLISAVDFEIPIFTLLLNLLVIVVPSVLGFFLGCYIPWLKKIAKVINYMLHSIVFTALFVAFLLISRWYALKYGKAIFILIGI